MLWFKKRDQIAIQKHLEERIELELAANTKQEDKTVREANEAADEFNRIIEENGFTLRIFQATGGKLKGHH